MKVSNDIIVAAIQFAPKLGDVWKNVAIAKQLSFEAAAKGAAVIVLPELCVSGNGFLEPNEAMNCAQEKDGPYTKELIEIAQRFNCHIVFGYIEMEQHKLYNSAAVVGPRGLEANVRKHNLFGTDNIWAQPSTDNFPIVMTRAGRLGVLICRDIMNKFRESYSFYNANHQFYKKGSVDTIALLTNWAHEFSFPDASWIDLSEQLQANVIVSNRIGTERHLQFKGGSAVISKERKIWSNGSSFDSDAVVGGIVSL